MKRVILIFGFAGFLLWGISFYPVDTRLAVSAGISICLETVIPVLFPFFVLSTFIVGSGVLRSPAAAFWLGLISGFPVGVLSAVEFYKKGLCDKGELERLITFCNNTGPGFVVLLIGANLFGSIRVGILLYIIQIVSAVLTGFIFKGWKLSSEKNAKKVENIRFSSLLMNSIKSAGKTMAGICFIIVFFSVFLRILELSGILSLMLEVVSSIFPFVHMANAVSLCVGLFELTNGVVGIVPSPEGFVVAAVLIVFGGFSIHLQTLSVLESVPVRKMKYFYGKFTQTIISFIFSIILLYFFSIV